MAFKSSFKAPKSERGFRESSDLPPIGNFYDKQRVRDDAERKRIEQEMVQRVVYGEVGDGGQGGYENKLNKELINPALPMTEAETNYRQDPFAVERMKRNATQRPAAPRSGGRAPADYTNQVIDYANSFRPGMMIDSGRRDPETNAPIMEPASYDAIIRAAKRRTLKYNPDDPRWEQIKEKWDSYSPPEVPEKKGLLRKAFDGISSASKNVSKIGMDMISDGTPGNSKDKTAPGLESGTDYFGQTKKGRRYKIIQSNRE